jgi:CheY-like chemotaxis protein
VTAGYPVRPAGDAASWGNHTPFVDELLWRQPPPHVILTSGFNEEETATRFAGKPLAGFLQKPYRAADLLAALARCVEEG